MTPCDQPTEKILRYLHNELSDRERLEFSFHKSTCGGCTARIEQEKSLSSVLHRSRPLYVAPAELRKRISGMIGRDSAKVQIPQKPDHWSGQCSIRSLRNMWLLTPRWGILAAIVLTAMAGLLLMPSVVQHVSAASYVETAASVHRAYLTGELPLEIRSDSSAEVAAWLSGRLQFAFQLPNSQSYPDNTPAYRLIGARLLDLGRYHAALVSYEGISSQTISLVVAPSKAVPIVGGEEIRFGDLIFHLYSRGALRIITWSNHGLSYALVSNLSVSPQGSCLVCHQSAFGSDAAEKYSSAKGGENQ
jgi:anti-sigma factor RsiW